MRQLQQVLPWLVVHASRLVWSSTRLSGSARMPEMLADRREGRHDDPASERRGTKERPPSVRQAVRV